MIWILIIAFVFLTFCYALVYSNEKEPWEDEDQERFMREWYEKNKNVK